MTITTMTSRQLNHDVSSAKKAATTGPVIITDRGTPAHVLLTYVDFQRLTGQQHSIIEALSMPGLSEIEFDAPRAVVEARAVDLS